MKRSKQFFFGILLGAGMAFVILMSLGATLGGPTWMKNEVTPVCFLKTDISGFVPLHGENNRRDRWTKEEVTPMLEVKAEQRGLIPLHGLAYGIKFKKEDIRPFISVMPDGVAFVPVR
jgi:hypothetical protein